MEHATHELADPLVGEMQLAGFTPLDELAPAGERIHGVLVIRSDAIMFEWHEHYGAFANWI